MREALADERSRPMTVQECRGYAEGYDNLMQQLEKPERQASNEEMQHMASLQGDAQRLLQQAQTAAYERASLDVKDSEKIAALRKECGGKVRAWNALHAPVSGFLHG